MNNILTLENMKKLQEELDYRMTVKRAEIAKDKLIAAALVIDLKMLSIKKLVLTIEKMITEYNIYYL